MAKVKGGTITFEITDNGSLKLVEKNSKKAAQSVKRVGQSAHSADRALKGAAQASSGASKNFSKMSQGITGGLVPAYATLAANLFAVDALFRFLKSSADFRVLTQGQTAFAAATGVAYQSLAKDLQAATRNMVSFRDAAQAGAIGRAAGLSAGQLNELADAAFTVSTALGRDVTDSFNRLIRGVTKAEPELLDELGIVLRLEEATVKYAAALGLNKNQLSIYQKSQAVVNEVLDQAETKFGKINEIMEPNANAIAQLGVAAEGAIDAIRPIISAIAEPAASFFKDNVTATITALGLFATSIINSVIPSIGELKIRQAEQSQAHIDDLKRMQIEYDKLDAKKKKLGGLPFQEKAKKAIGKKKLGMIGGESARKLERGEALSAREVGAIKGQITKRADELGISEKQKQRIFKQLDQVKGKASVTTQKIKLSTKTMGTSMQMQFKKIQMAGGTAFAFLEKQANRLTRAMSGLMSVMGFLGTAFLIFQLAKGAYDKFFGPDTEAIDRFTNKANEAKSSIEGLNAELFKMAEVRERGLIRGTADATVHTFEALQSASLTKNLANFELLAEHADKNRGAFAGVSQELARTFLALSGMDARFEEYYDQVARGLPLTEDQKESLAELTSEINNLGAAFKQLKQVEGEVVKEQNRLVQSLPKVPYQGMILLIKQQQQAYQDLVDNGLTEYSAHLENATARLEYFNLIQQESLEIFRLEQKLIRATKFSFLAGTNPKEIQFLQQKLNFEKELNKERDIQNQITLARKDPGSPEIQSLDLQLKKQKEITETARLSMEAAKVQMNDIFMTYNELYKGLERDLGNAIGAALRGDSSGFKKIGENFAKTLTDAIGQGLSKQLMDDLIPEALKPETVQSQIIKGSNFHAQEVQLSIETGAKFHAEAIDGVNAANEQALSKLVNQIIQSGIDVNKVRIANLDTERTFADTEAKKFAGMSTTEGIEKFQKDNPELFAEEARKHYISTLSGDELGDFREGERLKKSSDARINYLNQVDPMTGIQRKLSPDGIGHMIDALEDRKTSQDLLKNTQSEEEMISNYFGFLNARTMEASEKAKEYNKKVEQLDLEIDTLEAANTAAAGTKVDETLRATTSVEGGPATVAANKANKEAEENTKKGGENLDKFSTGLNQFAGTIGMFMALAGEDQKTAKLMAAVAKIQMAVAIADQVRVAMETKGGVLKQFAALFGFGGGGGARQGGIMSKHGRSYSQGGIAHGPSSGYGAVLHGREAVIPLPNGRSIPVEMGKGQMGTNNTNITVNMAEGSSEVTSDGSKQLAQAIDAAVQNTLEREMRPGGILGGG